MSVWTCASCAGENPEGTKFCGHCGASADLAAIPAGDADVADALRSFVSGPVAERLVEAGGHFPEERRLVTALFADVSGFTSLADRLDPEQLLEVIDPVISALSSVVGRHGGYVEKFAGDALMALFGAPVTHEDDAARAVRVALEMHEQLARVVDDLPHEAELTLHVGINSRHVLAELRSGNGGVLLVTGEAGIGKSRLLSTTLKRAAAARARILHARCLSYGAGVPYWPYVDLVRRETGLHSDEAPAETRARLGAALAASGAPETAPFFARLPG